MAERSTKRGDRLFSVVQASAVVLLVGWYLLWPILNPLEGPIETTKGKLVAVSMDASHAYSLPKELATIELAHGKSVHAVIPRNFVAIRGDSATLDVYQYHSSGVKEYRVVKIERAGGH